MASEFGSVAAGKIAYLKLLKHQDWHRKRVAAHIRSNIYGTNEYNMFYPSKRAGRKAMTSRLKGPILKHYYDDIDDRVLHSMTRNRKAHMSAMTTREQQTLFYYRRRKNLYWKSKANLQIGKKKLAQTINVGLFAPAYKYKSPRKYSSLKRYLKQKPTETEAE